MKKTFFSALLFLLLAAVVSPIPARATGLQNNHMTMPSTPSDVGIIFYKMIGSKPDFQLWAQTDPRYAKTDPAKQPSFLLEESAKLSSDYDALDVKKTQIIVRTAVNLQIKTNDTGAKQTLAVQFPGQGNLYFPYPVGGQTIAVIPNGIDLYRNIPVSLNEGRAIKARLDPTGNATMVVEIVPVKADGSAPVTMDRTQQWLMLGEIGYIAFFNNYLEMLWSFQAPWYTLQGQSSLLDLHKGGGSGKIPAQP